MLARHWRFQLSDDPKPTRAWGAAAGLLVGGGASIAAFALVRRALISSHWRFDVTDSRAWDMLRQYLPLYWERGVPGDALWLFTSFAGGLLAIIIAFVIGLFLGRFLGSPLRVVVLTLTDTAGALLFSLWTLFASSFRRRRRQTAMEDGPPPRQVEAPPRAQERQDPSDEAAAGNNTEPSEAARPRTRPRLTIGLDDRKAGDDPSVEGSASESPAAKTEADAGRMKAPAQDDVEDLRSSDGNEPHTPGMTGAPPQLADLIKQVTADESDAAGAGKPDAADAQEQPRPVDDLRAATVQVLRDLKWETLTDVYVNADYAMDFPGDRFDGDPGARIPLVALSPDEVLLVFFADLHGGTWTAAEPDEVTAGLPPWFSDDGKELESPVARAVRAKFRFELHHAPILERAGLVNGTVLPLVLACNGTVEDPDAVMAPWSRDHVLLKVVAGDLFQDFQEELEGALREDLGGDADGEAVPDYLITRIRKESAETRKLVDAA